MTAERGGRRLTVLNVTEEGRYGGPQQRIAEVASTLRDNHAIDTIVLMPAADSDRFQQVLDSAGVRWQGIRLHRLTKDIGHLARYVFFFFSELRAIGSAIRAVGPDVVHCNGSYQVKGVIAARLAGARSLWHLNDTFVPWLMRVVFDVVYRLCPPDGVVCSSQRTARYYFTAGRRRQPAVTRVIRPIVNTARFDPARDWPNPYPPGDGGVVRVLSVSNITPVKDHALLIRLAHEMNARGRRDSCRFYIAGTIFENHRAHYEELRELVGRLGVDNLVFLGARDDVPALLRHADVFICTSLHESGPMVVWEALSMARPVLSTDVGDVRELFETHRCGLVADSRDPRELATLLERLIDRPHEAAAMAQNGRAAAESLDVRHAAAQHAECYRELAGW